MENNILKEIFERAKKSQEKGSGQIVLTGKDLAYIKKILKEYLDKKENSGE